MRFNRTIPQFLVLFLILFCGYGESNLSPQQLFAAEQANEYIDNIFSSRPGVDLNKYKRKWLDLVYANQSPYQALDIYLPDEGKGPFPVIVALHGGSFVKGDKRDFQIVPMLEALKWGYAVIPVNYRLSPQSVFPSQIQDVKAAIRWIRANGDNYSLSTQKIAVWGDSAGGNLAALAGTSAGVKALEDTTMGNPEQDSRVDAVIDWYGPINFLSMSSQLQQNNQPPRKGNSSYIGKSKDEAPELYAAASPATYIHSGMPPFFIQHGNGDIVIPVQQSIELAHQLEITMGKNGITLDILDRANHLDERFTTADNLDKVRKFLDAVIN